MNKVKLGIVAGLIILVLFIPVFIVFIYPKNKNENSNIMNKYATNKNNKEQFVNIAPLSSDELLNKLKLNPEGIQEVVALDNLTETITDIIDSKIKDINNSKIADVNK